MKLREMFGCTLIVCGLFIATGIEENLWQGLASLACMMCAAALLGAFKTLYKEMTIDAHKRSKRSAANEAA